MPVAVNKNIMMTENNDASWHAWTDDDDDDDDPGPCQVQLFIAQGRCQTLLSLLYTDKCATFSQHSSTIWLSLSHRFGHVSGCLINLKLYECLDFHISRSQHVTPSRNVRKNESENFPKANKQSWPKTPYRSLSANQIIFHWAKFSGSTRSSNILSIRTRASSQSPIAIPIPVPIPVMESLLPLPLPVRVPKNYAHCAYVSYVCVCAAAALTAPPLFALSAQTSSRPGLLLFAVVIYMLPSYTFGKHLTYELVNFSFWLFVGLVKLVMP